ncbi:carbohydrate-binding module family 14 protein [Sphingobacterium paucimobilis]|uniref:Chitin-binding type-2 domain-containing protein n=1 Tax=Sphingobacterium paucimobilis HER1398 TaxID=1346330 RepID=U2HY10_9SPHI|nr:carbohydrate-binding module family 14 protein [Sphingobacterium paucimobilis]ERJ60150.1 hypothetical protein M472_15410 [Sphingobacterium paucimobilis HER1398]
MYKITLLAIWSLFTIFYARAIPVDSLFCKKLDDGKYPHPTECRAYYGCKNHITSVGACPYGQVFDPLNKQCDAPENVLAPCGTKVDTSHRIIVDGKLDEWSETKFVADKENLLDYAVHHDKDNLYIAIKKDRRLLKLMSGAKNVGGIQLYINRSGKKDTISALNIGYPLGGPEDREWHTLRLQEINPTAKKAQLVSIYNDYGITAAAVSKFEKNTLKNYTVEYRIPLVYILSEENPSKDIAICIMQKGVSWMRQPPAYTPGSMLYRSSGADAGLFYSDEDFEDMMSWSYTWFNYSL